MVGRPLDVKKCWSGLPRWCWSSASSPPLLRGIGPSLRNASRNRSNRRFLPRSASRNFTQLISRIPGASRRAWFLRDSARHPERRLSLRSSGSLFVPTTRICFPSGLSRGNRLRWVSRAHPATGNADPGIKLAGNHVEHARRRNRCGWFLDANRSFFSG